MKIHNNDDESGRLSGSDRRFMRAQRGCTSSTSAKGTTLQAKSDLRCRHRRFVPPGKCIATPLHLYIITSSTRSNMYIHVRDDRRPLKYTHLPESCAKKFNNRSAVVLALRDTRFRSVGPCNFNLGHTAHLMVDRSRAS
jgi:hypothetical protein